MVQPKVSFHLSVLKEAGLIKDRKEGRWIHYRLDDSDLLRRFLILSAVEKISYDDVKEDKERLEAFLENKKNPAIRSGLSATSTGKVRIPAGCRCSR